MKVIAIDGPAGSGKSTVARALAVRLGLPYLDTGAMYRGVAFAALRRGIDPGDDATVARLACDVELRVVDLDTGAALPPGEVGEIQARSPSLMAGYLPDEANADAYEAARAEVAGGLSQPLLENNH